MHPVLIDFGFDVGGLPIRLYTYGACMVLGLALAVVIFVWYSRRGHELFDLYLLALVTFLAGLLGSKLLFIVANFGYYRDLGFPLTDLAMSGMVWYGGVLLGVPAALVYVLIRRMKFLVLFDAAAPAMSVGHLWGRIGCFMAGCCYGSPTDLPWGVSFPPRSVAFIELLEKDVIPLGSTATMPLHPTQLYEAAGELAILACLLVFSRYKRFSGQVAGLYLVLYALMRFAVEFARGDMFRGGLVGLSTSQLVSIPLLLVGVGLLGWRFVWKRTGDS
jgi:phosphatidylglycerol:prolipoprotein diacylglycerol transferase